MSTNVGVGAVLTGLYNEDDGSDDEDEEEDEQDNDEEEDLGIISERGQQRLVPLRLIRTTDSINSTGLRKRISKENLTVLVHDGEG
jgi:hypothetical protein